MDSVGLRESASDPDMEVKFQTLNSDPDAETEFEKRYSSASEGSEAEELSNKIKNANKKKLNRARSGSVLKETASARRPLRSTIGANTAISDAGSSSTPKLRNTVGTDTFPEQDSSSSPGASPIKIERRKSPLLSGTFVTARRSVNRHNEEHSAVTEDQERDWNVLASRVATVMYMSNAELAKGIKALEREEVEEIAELFGLFDMDQSGALDDSELGSLVRALGVKANQGQILKVLGWMDKEESIALAQKGGAGRKTIMQMVQEKAVDFDAFVQLLLRLRAEGPPKLDRKVAQPEIVDPKGKPLKQTLILLDAIEKVLAYSDDSWPDGIPKKKLKDSEIVIKACDTLVELSKHLQKEKEMLECLQTDLMIFKAQLQSRNKKGAKEVSAVGSKHKDLKKESIQLTNEVQAAKEELAKEKEKYKKLRTAAVPELVKLDAEVTALSKKLERWEQRVREDSLCARDLAELQKAKEQRLRELAPKVTQCSELQKKCEASYQVNVVLKSLLLECCANFDLFIDKKEAPLRRLENCGLEVQKCIQGLVTDHERLSKASVVASDGVPDAGMPLVTGVGGAD